MGQISDWMIGRMEKAVDKATRLVMDAEAKAASVTVTFAIGRDKDDAIEGKFSVKGAAKEESDWYPRYPRQPELPLNGNGKSVADELAEKAAEALDGTTVTGPDGGKVTVSAKAGN